MCEAVEKYAQEYAKRYAKEYAQEYAQECVIREKIDSVRNLMGNMKLSMEQALDALNIHGDEREYIIRELQK